jgi:hypothetical protein
MIGFGKNVKPTMCNLLPENNILYRYLIFYWIALTSIHGFENFRVGFEVLTVGGSEHYCLLGCDAM